MKPSPVKPMLPSRVIRLWCMASVLFCNLATAQDFDGDSIYYTPIKPPAPATVDRNVGVFRDTTTMVRRVQYYFDVNMGMLTGCHDCITGTEFTFSTATTHGITLGRKSRLGAGVGFDTYVGWKALPIFASASYDLAGTKNTHAVFVQAQYGWGFVWRQLLPFDSHPTEEQGGMVYAGLIGYRVRYHNLRISIATGFKQQEASSVYLTENWIPNEKGEMIRGTPNRTTVETKLGRAMLNLTFAWR